MRTSSWSPSAYRNCDHGNTYVRFNKTISRIEGRSCRVSHFFGLSANTLFMCSFHLTVVPKILSSVENPLLLRGDCCEFPGQRQASTHALVQPVAGFSNQFRRGQPRGRGRDGFAKPVLMAGNDQHALFPTRRCDVKQLFPHTVAGNNDAIDGFALAAMCCHGVPVSKVFECPRYHTSILEVNASFLIHFRDRYDFPVRGPECGLATIRRQQQLVARRDLDSASFNTSKDLACFAEIILVLPRTFRTTRLQS